MDLKEFLKINLLKLGVTSIITILFLCFTKVPTVITMRSGPSRFQFVDYTYFLSHFPKMIYFDYEILTFLVIILEIAIIYIISCFIDELIRK